MQVLTPHLNGSIKIIYLQKAFISVQVKLIQDINKDIHLNEVKLYKVFLGSGMMFPCAGCLCGGWLRK